MLKQVYHTGQLVSLKYRTTKRPAVARNPALYDRIPTRTDCILGFLPILPRVDPFLPLFLLFCDFRTWMLTARKKITSTKAIENKATNT